MSTRKDYARTKGGWPRYVPEVDRAVNYISAFFCGVAVGVALVGWLA